MIFRSSFYYLIGCLVLSLVLLGVAPPSVAAQGGPSAGHGAPNERMGFDQKLNQALPQDLAFVDDLGNPVLLSNYFGQERPVVLALGYFECPVLCSLVRRAMVESLAQVGLVPGQDFEVVVVSIDPNETPMQAGAEKAALLSSIGANLDAPGWHFLTGEQAAIDQLAAAIGFRYYYDDQIGQFAHPSGLVMLTPQGIISRYFYGIDYPATDLRLGLVESSEGRIGSLTDQFLLLCYQYNPETGRYSGYVMGIVRIAGALTALAIFATLGFVWLRTPRTPTPPSVGHDHVGQTP